MIRLATYIILFIQIISTRSSVIPQPKEFNDSYKNKDSLPATLTRKVVPNHADTLAVEPPLFIGSFNIQTLGRKKFRNDDIMYIVEKIILRYDLILIMEIQTDKDNYMNTLLKDVNLLLPPEQAYGMILSERKNETKEHYAFLFRKNKLKVISSESYDDPSVFYRKPLIAVFEAFTLRDMKKFGAVGQHVKPSDAVKEISGLANIYDYMKWKYETEDVLFMGDFNADCDYVKENSWDKIALWSRSEFTWAISNKIDTTTNYRSCALDRFVYAGENMNDGVILSSAGIFNFQEEYMLSVYETRNISDHWPIELKIRGKMSEVAEKYLTSYVCFYIQDSQKKGNITDEVIKSVKKSFFDMTKTADGILLRNQTSEVEDMLEAVKTLRFHLPKLVGGELEEAIKYKVEHGSLNDDSSFADISVSKYTIDILSTNEMVKASICRTTSVN